MTKVGIDEQKLGIVKIKKQSLRTKGNSITGYFWLASVFQGKPRGAWGRPAC